MGIAIRFLHLWLRTAVQGSLSLASTIGSVVLAASIYLAAAVTGFSIQFANTPLGRLLEIAAAFGISWVVVIAYRLVWALFALGTRQLREINSLKAQVSEKVSKPNTLADAIQISYEEREPYRSTSLLPDGVRRFEFSVQVTNVGNGFLTECAVWVKSISIAPNAWEARLIHPATSLRQGEYKFVRIVFFDEGRQLGKWEVDAVMLSKEYTARAIGSNRHVLPIGVDELPVVVTIEVMARECRAAQAHFRIYAEQGPRRIRMEPA